MSSHTVIKAVTKTLAGVLNSETGVEVETEKSPADTISDNSPLIHLFLYSVHFNPSLINGDWRQSSPTTLQQPPLGLNLFYFITPYGKGQTDIQMTLGEIIKVFHDLAVIPPASFDPGLADTTEELRVIHHPLTLQEMTEFWRSFEKKSFRLSLAYEVSAVFIDSDVTRTVTRVDERRLQVRPVS